MTNPLPLCHPACCLPATPRPPLRIVLTGGPGAGKTAVLETARLHFCRGVVVLPEAASILFRGGFPRAEDGAGRRAAQRAIFHVTAQLERMEVDRGRAAVLLCDRGTIDGAAYWPGDFESYFEGVGTTYAEELSHYDAVVHLRVPHEGNGYDLSNPVRTETAEEAAHIDDRILAAWEGHPNRFIIDSTDDFVAKVDGALDLLRTLVPEACRPRRQVAS